MTGNVKTKTTRGASAAAAGKRCAMPEVASNRPSGSAAREGCERPVRPRRAGGKADAAVTRPAPAIIQPRAGTKRDRLVSLLSKKAGADVAALSAALGWQAHTTRAALTRLRQAGFPLEAVKPAGGGAKVYRIPGGTRPGGCAE